MYMGEGGS